MSVPSTSRCLVTGATDPTSVGYVCAHILLQAGAAAVTITGRDPAKLEAAVASLKQANNNNSQQVYGIASDLTMPETMEATVEEAAKYMGGSIDILVISGGNGGSEWLGLDSKDPESYRLLQNMAVISPMLLTHAVVAKQQGNDDRSSLLSVVMVSSAAATTAWPDTCCYNVNKAAQNCLVQQLAFQYRAHNVRVNAVLAGCIHTGALDRMAIKKNVSIADYADFRAGEIPVQRNGTPEDVAQAVLYLASPASSFTTGCLLPVDGGLHLSNWFNKPKMLAEYQGNAKMDSKE